MGAGGAARQFWDELRTLYESAGSPTLEFLVSLGKQQLPPAKVSDTTLSEWLTGKTVPSRRNSRFFLTLATVLQQRAKAKSAYQLRSEGWWQQLLVAAQTERSAAQKPGRPRRPADPEPATGSRSFDVTTARAAREQGSSRYINAAPVAVRRALPADLANFVGRSRELDELYSIISNAEQTQSRTAGNTVVISAIDGMGGVGKTALAIHAAHAVSAQYPDAQLYVDLHGFDPSGQPVADPAAVVADFLLLLGLSPEQIPATLDARTALYRDQLAEKHALILLDNAADETQVRPLLPAGDGCLVIITSRNRLAGLDAAKHLSLHVFEPDEALALLKGVLGEQRVDVDLDSAKSICQLVGYLGIALAIAARRIQSRPSWTLSYYVAKLAQSQRRLKELAAGDTAVSAVFDLSYRPLSEKQRRVFRLMGIHPGTDATASSIAALADLHPTEAEEISEALVDQHLLQQVTPGRYQMHDLLRAYARDRAQIEESTQDRHESLRKVVNWYLHTAHAAGKFLGPSRRTVSIDPTFAPAHIHSFDDYQQALAWCEIERHAITSAVYAAFDNALYDLTWQLPVVLWDFYYLRKHWDDWLATTSVAIAATTELNDRAARAAVLSSAGVAHRQIGQLHQALDYFQQVLHLRRELHDTFGEGATLANLGVTYRHLGRYDDALACYKDALRLNREAGDKRGEGITLNNLAEAHRFLGHYDKALDYYTSAYVCYQEAGDKRGEGIVLSNLGETHLALRNLKLAKQYLRNALDIRREVGDRGGIAITLDSLAQVLAADGSWAEARGCWLEALDVFNELNDKRAADIRSRLSISGCENG